MFRKLAIAIISFYLVAFNANAGSDGSITLKKDQPEEIKDCFEKLNRATLTSGLSGVAINILLTIV